VRAARESQIKVEHEREQMHQRQEPSWDDRRSFDGPTPAWNVPYDRDGYDRP